nr:MAG TPA: hypothetical protein [Caudoviricetes sp.]
MSHRGSDDAMDSGFASLRVSFSLDECPLEF